MKVNYDLNSQDLYSLPSAQTLESSVLGCIINTPDVLDRIYKYLNQQGIFYHELNNTLWQSIKSLFNKGVTPDLMNVTVEAQKLGDKDFILHVAYCVQQAILPTDIEYRCLKLIEFSVRRHCIRLGYDINQSALNGKIDPLSILNKTSSDIDELFHSLQSLDEVSLQDTADELVDVLKKISDSGDGIMGLHGSLNRLNRVIAGYRKGNLIVLSASPGEGKTTFAIQEAMHMAVSGHPIGYITLEMPSSELMLKMVCIKNGLNIDNVVKGHFTTEQGVLIGDSLEYLKKLPIHFCDKSGMKISEVKAQARSWAKQKKIECLFIDLMHLIVHDDSSKGMEDKFSDIANQLKFLAKELDIPIVSLAHLSRKEKGTNRLHHMTDLKYSGGIEGAADVILFIYRPEVHDESDPEGRKPNDPYYSLANRAKIYTGKIRLVKGGSIECHFDGNTFTEINSFGHQSGDSASNFF